MVTQCSGDSVMGVGSGIFFSSPPAIFFLQTAPKFQISNHYVELSHQLHSHFCQEIEFFLTSNHSGFHSPFQPILNTSHPGALLAYITTRQIGNTTSNQSNLCPNCRFQNNLSTTLRAYLNLFPFGGTARVFY